MSNYPEDNQKQIEQKAFENNHVGGNVSIGNLTQTVINQILQPNNDKNSFCGLIKWIHKKSESLEGLHPEYGKEILRIIRKIPDDEKFDFTVFEVKVLSLVLNYCHYYSQGGKARSDEFVDFTEKDYLFQLNELVNTKEKIRIKALKLSDLIADKKISLLVKRLENSNGF
ncbi:hypothetical protein IQ247_16285 [Plectonema cf. radiosum LEGE 06105]|uniref:Uncharacterized protein n=1 Tax=Plectonema cf. radiosum LEGE 06105 TaxID=945769 RepID=A0A8J7F191_9CYAN|nr:hypothetical protein [Plectonema radiosum]MBE9214206.1 hypothetical protein [Plectonema cf. radiosum LEGE 06105]